MTHALQLKNIVKRYGEYVAVDDLSLEVPEGAFVSLLGASGCGKSSTLRIIAGLETVDSGEITFRGQGITQHPPGHRDMRMMFQDYALFPNMSLAENVEFPLTIRRNRSKFAGRQKELVHKYLELVQMSQYAARKPHQISGGQRQRIALARALVSDPSIVLFDEPLGALDTSLRHAMQFELKRIHTEYGKTFISVTHDQEEAMALSDLIALMKDGKILQIGSPTEIYSRPNCRYVAEFIGAGSSVLDVNVDQVRDGSALLRLSGDVVLESRVLPPVVRQGSKVGLHVRPERVEIFGSNPDYSLNVLPGVIENFIFLGGRTEYQVRLAQAPTLILRVARSGPPISDAGIGAKVFLGLDPYSVAVLDR